MRFLVVIMCVVILVAIFSTQNSQPVSVSFLVWQFRASLAIVVFLCVLSGIVIGILASFLIRLSKQRKGKEKAKNGPEADHTTTGSGTF